MTFGQRAVRTATDLVVRVPWLWRLVRRPITANFDRLAATWDVLRVDDERLRALDAALASIRPEPLRVLDLGTGSGAVARRASERWPSAEVTGVDISSEMIAQARRLATSERQRYEVADASRLPFPDGAFDLVAQNNVIPFFDELARVTAPGGSVAIAFGLGARTPIWVPLDRVGRELVRRGFEDIQELAGGGGLALTARKSATGRA